MKAGKLIITALFAICIYSCSYDSESDLIDAVDPIDPDIIVTYVDNVEAIIQSACIGCHSDPPVNGAPVPWVTYDQVNQRANDILNRMSRQSGAPGAMPPSGRLPQSTIDIIEQWIEDGKLEN
ncbi:hypothetical protein [Winogradskyella flava]|uniref:hypothetical protein n=1 Tax=Winogradskyella flava TaxID=1884876 RepID=UPI002493A0AA|nr:hypothetical protein [Winogradskyella flava]